MRIYLALLACLFVSPAFAQSATVAIFAGSATDPNTAKPLNTPVTYAPVCGYTPKMIETTPIINPAVGAFDDPANPLLDCRLDVATQFAALSIGSGYKAAVRVGTGPYGAFSNAFAVQSTTHPCDTTPISRTTALVGQPVTVGVCHPLLDVNGNPTTPTSYRVYRNGILLTLTPTVSAASLTGWVLASFTRTETVAGSSSYEVSAVNAVGESTRSAPLAVTVTQPAAVPVPPGRGRIQ